MNGILTVFTDAGRRYFRIETERNSTHQSGSYESNEAALEAGRANAKSLGVTITEEKVIGDELAPIELIEPDELR